MIQKTVRENTFTASIEKAHAVQTRVVQGSAVL